MNTVYVIGVTAAALTLALLAVPPTDLTLARDKNEPVIRAPHDVPALPARDDAAPPQQPANYSPEELDRTMVRIPAGPFLFGMTDQEKQAAAKEAGVHPDMLRHHSSRQLLTTKEFWIDKYPVTRGQFQRFLKATGYKIPYNGWLVAWRDCWAIPWPIPPN